MLEAAVVADFEVSAEAAGAAGDDVAHGARLGRGQAEAVRVIAQHVGDFGTVRPLGGTHRLLGLHLREDVIEGTPGVVHVRLRDVGVHLGGGETLVPEQRLDDADVGAAFEEMCGKGMPFIPRAG